MKLKIIPFFLLMFATYIEIIKTISIKENAGDMVRSDYLIIDERTLPEGNNKIYAYDCLSICSNCKLFDILIMYNYMYL